VAEGCRTLARARSRFYTSLFPGRIFSGLGIVACRSVGPALFMGFLSHRTGAIHRLSCRLPPPRLALVYKLMRLRIREGEEFANLRTCIYTHSDTCIGDDVLETRRRVPPQISGTGGMLWSVPPQSLITAHNFSYSPLEQFIEH
jgi:hypothetical protein